MVKSHWKHLWQVLKKLNVYLSYDASIPILGMYARDM